MLAWSTGCGPDAILDLGRLAGDDRPDGKRRATTRPPSTSAWARADATGSATGFFPNPPFERKVLEEDEAHILYINHEGILMRERKDNPYSSMLSSCASRSRRARTSASSGASG